MASPHPRGHCPSILHDHVHIFICLFFICLVRADTGARASSCLTCAFRLGCTVQVQPTMARAGRGWRAFFFDAAVPSCLLFVRMADGGEHFLSKLLFCAVSFACMCLSCGVCLR